jgi:hypothetical protein
MHAADASSWIIDGSIYAHTILIHLPSLHRQKSKQSIKENNKAWIASAYQKYGKQQQQQQQQVVHVQFRRRFYAGIRQAWTCHPGTICNRAESRAIIPPVQCIVIATFCYDDDDDDDDEEQRLRSSSP